MKNLILFIIASFISSFGTLKAQTKNEKQTVYSLVKERRTTHWYQQQAKLWKKDIDQNQQNKEAWLNYYTAQRMLKIFTPLVSAQDLDKIVKNAEKYIPNSFEHHYIAYWNSGLSNTSEDNILHLKKAQSIGPNRVELMDDLFTYYEINNEQASLIQLSKKWFGTNDISSGLYAWNYNLLQSVDLNAILFTFGDNDTYPARVLQNAKGVRNDVALLNVGLLRVEKYRTNVFKRLGIPNFTPSNAANENWIIFQKAIINHVKSNTKRPIFVAVSSPKDIQNTYKESLYNVGLASKLTDSKFDNIAVTKRNYEKKFLLDYLKIDLQNDISQGVVNNANTNYLVPFLTLFNHYKESENERAKEIKMIIETIAEQNQIEDQINPILNPRANDVGNTSTVLREPKQVEKYITKVNDTLYATYTEVNNEMYNLFLTDLIKQKRYKDLNMAKAEAVDWRSLLPKEKKNLPYDSIFPNGHPDNPLSPVVNVSYQAAQLYCQWLTTSYNNLDHKRKKYDRVEFRLPTEKEWELIAAGGNNNYTYAWKGPFVRNSKGCFLTNLNTNLNDPKPEGMVKDSSQCDMTLNAVDGSVFPVRGDAYFPNSFGLYCMIGNVSEMVLEKGITKGGSWNTKSNQATITSKEKMNGASAEIGFRVIMIVHAN